MKKKLLLLISIATLLCGCSIQRDVSSSSVSSSTAAPISSSITPEPSSTSITPEPSSSSVIPEPSSSSEKPEPISSSTIAPEPSSSTIKPEPSSSSVVPPSPSSSSIKPTPSSSSSEGHEHVSEEKWSYDSEKHWHECTAHDGYKFNEGAHDFEDEIIVAPTYDKSGETKHTCKVCEYSYTETVPALGYEVCCDDMNKEIKDKQFFDVFEIKDYLFEKGFNPELNFEISKYFGFDEAKGKVIIYTVKDGIVYPDDCKSDVNNYVSFQTYTVNSIIALRAEITQISEGKVNYSTLKLGNDLEFSESESRIVLNSKRPLQIDLNQHKITSNKFNGYNFYVDDKDTVISIVNGEISTITATGFDMSVAPSPMFVANAKTARISNCKLVCNAERGYCFIDSEKADASTKIKLNDNTMNATFIAVAIQSCNYIVEDCVIDGVVAVNGGSLNMTGCTVSAKFSFNPDDKKEFVTNEAISEILLIYLKEWAQSKPYYDHYVFSSTDAIIVLDRRSVKSTYKLGKVSISNTTMNAYTDGSVVYGYGFRYVDLNNDPNQSTNNKDNVTLSKNNYPKCSSTGSASGQPGGYSYYSVL